MSPSFNYFLTPDILKQIEIFRNHSGTDRRDISLDLGVNQVNGSISGANVIKVGKLELNIPSEIIQFLDERTIYIWRTGHWEKWQAFDEKTAKYYKMVFVKPDKPPTIEISGIKMHITKEGDPQKDTQLKLKSLKRIEGILLDTCMGLGYTAIAAANHPAVEKVYCCEKDPVVFRFCQENPWSQSLFRQSKIHPLLYPIDQFVSTLPDFFVHTIIHDPPRFALAPELYSERFYSDLYRILIQGGEIYHYTGDPNRQTRRTSLPQKTRQLLIKTGFRQVKFAYAGLMARK